MRTLHYVLVPISALLFSSAQLGCLDTWVPSHAEGDTPAQIHAPIVPGNAFATLNAPAAAHTELCTPDAQHPNFPDDADMLTKVFCQDLKPGGVMPTPHGLDN